MSCGYKCLCDSCANNVNNVNAETWEVRIPCFRCEEKCYEFDHSSNKVANPLQECLNYISTNYHAAIKRTKFKIIN